MADAAGDIARRAYRTPGVVEHKQDASPVTQTDREVEAAMRSLIEATFPAHGIIGEEFGNVRENARFQWVLDPIDGTRSFIAGYPLFTTLISLVCDGVPLLGVINQPITNERWIGVKGAKTIYERAFQAATFVAEKKRAVPMAHAVIASTSIDYFTPEQMQSFLTLKKQCANSVLGGDALAYAMLASGGIDIVVDAGLKTYDFCALAPVIEGMGGVISDWRGHPITLGSDGRVIAARNAILHEQALTFLL